MQPIISPWFFYLLHVVDSIIVVCTIIAVFSGIAFLISILGWLVIKYDDLWDEDYLKVWKRILKLSLPILIISMFLAVFIPSKNTIIAMYVSRQITSDNVEKTLDVGKNFKEEIKKDIFELIEAIQDKKEKKSE